MTEEPWKDAVSEATQDRWGEVEPRDIPLRHKIPASVSASVFGLPKLLKTQPEPGKLTGMQP